MNVFVFFGGGLLQSIHVICFLPTTCECLCRRLSPDSSSSAATFKSLVSRIVTETVSWSIPYSGPRVIVYVTEPEDEPSCLQGACWASPELTHGLSSSACMTFMPSHGLLRSYVIDEKRPATPQETSIAHDSAGDMQITLSTSNSKGRQQEAYSSIGSSDFECIPSAEPLPEIFLALRTKPSQPRSRGSLLPMQRCVVGFRVTAAYFQAQF